MTFYLIFLAYTISHKFDEFTIVVLVAATTFSILDSLFPSVKETTIHGKSIGFSLNNSF